MNFLAAARSLLEHWQRAALSALGIMVASVAIVLLISIARGVEADITSQVDQLGVNVLVVVPGRVELASGMGFNPNLGGQSFLAFEDAPRLRAVEGVREVAILNFSGGGIRYQDREAYPFIIATTPEWFRMQRSDLEAGAFFTEQDADQPVAVIGSVARNRLFREGEDPIGATVTINQGEYRVVGVMADEEGDSLFSAGGFQDVVYIPLPYLQTQQEFVKIDRFMIQGAPDAEPKRLVSDLEAVLEQRLDRQQFSVLTQEDLLGLIYRVTGILSWLLVGLTSIALFVGGVGVMAIMLMAVNERNKEIGVRKAMGARRRDIFWQFLMESVIIGVVGVMAGIVISLIVSAALRIFTPIDPLVTVGTVLLAFGVGVGIGSVFGLIPSMHAARQDPVVALRNE